MEQLTALQKHWRKQLLRLGLVTSIGSFFIALGMACAFSHWGLIRLGAGLAISSLIILWGWGLYRFHSPFTKARFIQPQLAALAEILVPELGSAASSAVHFETSPDKPTNSSENLVETHILQTHELLSTVNFEERLRLHFQERQRRALIFACFGILLGSAVMGGLTEGRGRLFRSIFQPNAVQISEAPLAGDIQLVYHYPAYTGMGSVVIEGGNGSIRALVGTQVEIQATTEEAVSKAELRQSVQGSEKEQIIPMAIQKKHTLKARLSVMTDGLYSFALHTESGDHLQDKQRHPIVAVPDTYPQMKMDSPMDDIELRDNQTISILWHAKDDHGVAEVNLVIEPDALETGDGPSSPDALRIPLGQSNQVEKRREGRYTWSLANLSLEPGQGAKFYLEALDNDSIGGPKRTTSEMRRLNIFSARRHHEKVLLAQNKALDAMVDWLGQDLQNPAGQLLKDKSLAPHQKTVEQIKLVAGLLQGLVANLEGDELAKLGVVDAFRTILEHTQLAMTNRTAQLKRLEKPQSRGIKITVLRNFQNQAVTQLEKDIIYLDDLLAVQRIDELKETAKDLLAAQNQLQDLLAQYKETQDPKLRDALQSQIKDLRRRMLELLQKMSRIKKHLPGEYRNMEAGSMLKIDDQLSRLETMLQNDDLEGAAQELEQLANMIEQMMDSIDDAEEEYGGERYEAIREKLNQFSQSFQQLERQQQALSKRTDQMMEQYREKAMKKAGKDIDDFIKKIKELTAEALSALDPLADLTPKLRDPRRTLDNTRQRLLDLDALIEQRDFAEAHQMAKQAVQHILAFQNRLIRHTNRFGKRKTKEMKDALDITAGGRVKIVKVKEELDKLFPDPEEILSKEQMQQMERMAEKQQELQQEAQKMGGEMQQLAQEVPLFGGQPQQNLRNAQSQMQQAGKNLREGKLSQAARNERMALEQLGQLRKALEQSSKGNKGGLPMPLGSSGRQGKGRRNAQGFSKENVELPQTQSQNKNPRFRKELLDAAKQKAPKRYEEAVRKYYEELIK